MPQTPTATRPPAALVKQAVPSKQGGRVKRAAGTEHSGTSQGRHDEMGLAHRSHVGAAAGAGSSDPSTFHTCPAARVGAISPLAS